MLDIQFIRDNADAVEEKSKQKGYNVDIRKLLELDTRRRDVLRQLEGVQRERNEHANRAKGAIGNDTVVQEGRRLKEQIAELEKMLAPIESEYTTLLKAVPNMPLKEVHVGASEADNKVIRTVGGPTKFDFKPKSHWELGEQKDWIDKKRASKVSGSRFVYLKGDVVLLQFVIIQFVLDILTNETIIAKIIKDNGLSLRPTPFTPILPPYMVRTEVFDAMDRLEPRDDRYKVGEDEDDLWLEGSAEHVIGPMFMGETLLIDDLPRRFVGYASSFRREAGSYGKDTEGLIRLHQFDKLEMEVFSTPETGHEEHKLLVAIQEYFMQQLGIPYQVIQKCTADIGKPNAQGVDIEAWMPSQNKYRETHTADYMTDYQARRLKTKVKTDTGNTFVHMNDATAFALGRTMAALIENCQTKDGSMVLPDILKPYFPKRDKHD